MFKQVTWYKVLHGLLDSFTYVISCFIFTSALKRKQNSSDCIHFTDEGTKALKVSEMGCRPEKDKTWIVSLVQLLGQGSIHF